jgi:uncharacterized protein (TIGR03435 family)
VAPGDTTSTGLLLSVEGALKLPRTVAGSCRTWDPKVGPPPNDPNQPPLCSVWSNGALPGGALTLEANGVTLGDLARALGNLLGRPGLYSTGSEELFDVSLEFANPKLAGVDVPAGGTGANVSALPGGQRQAPPAASESSGFPSIFTALRKVGLTVKAGRGPLEVFVVDSVQQPSDLAQCGFVNGARGGVNSGSDATARPHNSTSMRIADR